MERLMQTNDTITGMETRTDVSLSMRCGRRAYAAILSILRKIHQLTTGETRQEDASNNISRLRHWTFATW